MDEENGAEGLEHKHNNHWGIKYWNESARGEDKREKYAGVSFFGFAWQFISFMLWQQQQQQQQQQ